MKLFHPPDLFAPKGDDELEYTPLQLTRLRNSAIQFQKFVLAALALMLAAGVLAVLVGKQNDARIEADRKARSHASCLQQNRHDREFLEDFAVATGQDPQAPYVQEGIAKFRRRDCTQEGIDAYFKNPPRQDRCVGDGKGFCKR